MRNLLTLLGGICLIASSVGCCCLSGGCQPYYGGYGTGGGCPTGQCAPAGGPIYPQTGYNTYSAPPVATGPTTYYSGYTNTAFAPTESLPTY